MHGVTRRRLRHFGTGSSFLAAANSGIVGQYPPTVWIAPLRLDHDPLSTTREPIALHVPGRRSRTVPSTIAPRISRAIWRPGVEAGYQYRELALARRGG